MNAKIATGLLGVFALFAACSSPAEQAASGGDSGGEGGSAGGGTTGGAGGVAGGSNAGGAGGIAGGVNTGGAGGGTGGWIGAGGGVPSACADVGGDYGDCALPLGWGFDGTGCKLFNGCDCQPNCGSFFPSETSCATTCAAAGHCDTMALKPLYLAKDPVEQGDHCDGVDICTPEASLSSIQEIFPSITCDPGNCEGASHSCNAYYHGPLTAEKWEKLCAASLLPGIENIFCVIYGP